MWRKLTVCAAKAIFNFQRARLWRAEVFSCRAGFYTLPTNFLSARCETAPYIEPNFPCRAGFYTLPTNFSMRGAKPRPTLSQISFVGQGFIPCRRIFYARCKTAPYIKPIFFSARQEHRSPIQRKDF